MEGEEPTKKIKTEDSNALDQIKKVIILFVFSASVAVIY